MVSMSQQLPGHESGIGADDRPRPSVRERGLGREGRDILARTVERDVIPLLVAMPWIKAREPGAGSQPAPAIDSAVVAQMVTLCLAPEAQAVALYVSGLHGQGVSPEALYTELLTPVARKLGDMWVEDECTFADVTLAVLRLQNAQRSLAPQFVGQSMPGVGAPRILLLPVPGEQHTFGL